jgi:multiple sugar transport system permease protein
MPTRRASWRAVKEQWTGYCFIAPAVLLITVFGLFPIGYAVYMSLYAWRVRQGRFIGLGNYAALLGDGTGVLTFVSSIVLLGFAYWVWHRALQANSTSRLCGLLAVALILLGASLGISMGWGRMLATAKNTRFLNALPITLFYAVGSIPVQLALALGLASVLFRNLQGQGIFRTVFFVPYVMPTVATAMVFRTLFSDRSTSIANRLLTGIGLEPQKWLAEPRPVLEVLFGLHLPGYWAGPSLALVSIMLFGIWTFVGYNVLVFLAGLSAISPELYEAGRVDGASEWDLFRHITLPLLSPITFYLALIGCIGTLKAFNHLYTMRTPLAQDTVDTASVVIFDTFFKANQYGEAAAQAMLLFLLILGLTYVQNALAGEQVFYG